MNIVFAGTPAFAVPTLQACLDSRHRLRAVYTQPDRPSGRGRQIVPSPVKALALRHGVPVFQPDSLRSLEEQEQLRCLDADILVVAAYGLILPPAILAIPRSGSVNVHASLLPRWRGAAPIPRAILAGDEATGVTIMQIQPRLDAGPMYLRRSCTIGPGESAGELQDRLSKLGAEALVEVLDAIEAGVSAAEPQDESLVTYAEKLTKQEACLDWSNPARLLERQVRAFNPWPVAETTLDGLTLRIWRAEAIDEKSPAQPGSVLPARKTWDVATGAGVLRLLEVQLPGRRRMTAQDYLNAHALPTRLGDRAGG